MKLLLSTSSFFCENEQIIFCEVGKRFGSQGMITMSDQEYNVSITKDFWNELLSNERFKEPKLESKPGLINSILFKLTTNEEGEGKIDDLMKLPFVVSVEKNTDKNFEACNNTSDYYYAIQFNSIDEESFENNLILLKNMLENY